MCSLFDKPLGMLNPETLRFPCAPKESRRCSEAGSRPRRGSSARGNSPATLATLTLALGRHGPGALELRMVAGARAVGNLAAGSGALMHAGAGWIGAAPGIPVEAIVSAADMLEEPKPLLLKGIMARELGSLSRLRERTALRPVRLLLIEALSGRAHRLHHCVHSGVGSLDCITQLGSLVAHGGLPHETHLRIDPHGLMERNARSFLIAGEHFLFEERTVAHRRIILALPHQDVGIHKHRQTAQECVSVLRLFLHLAQANANRDGTKLSMPHLARPGEVGRGRAR